MVKSARIPVWLCLAAALGACRGGAPAEAGPPVEAVTAPAAAAVDTTGPPEAEPPAVRPAAAALGQGPLSTRFPHAPHRNVACRTCHGSIQGHATHTTVPCRACHAAAPVAAATARELTREECLGCHHGAQQTVGCPTCHAPVPPRTVQRPIQLSVWRVPRATSLPFDHDRHAGLRCAACHQEPPLLRPERACGSCHAFHHRAEATCTSCHAAPPPGAHDLHVHDGCSGAGCHAESAVSDLPRARATCLVCHRDRVDHQPGRECAPCHRLSAEGAP